MNEENRGSTNAEIALNSLDIFISSLVQIADDELTKNSDAAVRLGALTVDIIHARNELKNNL